MQRMEAHLSQRLEQRMKLSPQMVQNLQMLQMPVLELRDLIVQELQENPALELREDVEEPDVARDENSSDSDESNVQMEILETLDPNTGYPYETRSAGPLRLVA